MRIAYFIMLHHKFSQSCWLFDAIYTEEDVFLIHVDKKSNDKFYDQVRSYIGTLPNVSFLPRRAVTWCGWSSVSVELQAMRVLLDSDVRWQYLINVSGQDYPIKSVEFIKKKLQAEWPRNFIRAWSFAKVQELEPDDPHLKRILVFDVFGRLVRTSIRLPFPASIDIKYKGSAWHMLTRDFCRWLLRSPTRRRIEKLVKYTWNPDELFFPTLIMNSPHRDLRTEDFGREIIWPGPKTLRMEDYERLSASQALFARKFDDSVDQEVLVHLASDNGYRVPRVRKLG
jgi:hypothetical protein